MENTRITPSTVMDMIKSSTMLIPRHMLVCWPNLATRSPVLHFQPAPHRAYSTDTYGQCQTTRALSAPADTTYSLLILLVSRSLRPRPTLSLGCHGDAPSMYAAAEKSYRDPVCRPAHVRCHGSQPQGCVIRDSSRDKRLLLPG